MPQVPLEQRNWEKPKPILIVPQKISSSSGVHYHFGGLPALMQAARKLFENSQAHCVYVSDGATPKSILSGHQAHVHPTEWPTPDCKTLNLCKIFLRGAGLLPSPSPHDLRAYTYLHFPILPSALLQAPFEHFKLYSAFFLERLSQNLHATNGVSPHDHRLCDMVQESLYFHEKLNQEIEASGQPPTFKRIGRIYWSFNKAGIEHKRALWKELGIETTPLSSDALERISLLRKDRPITAINVIHDGKFFPETPIRIVQFLKARFPDRFTAREGIVAQIDRDPDSSLYHQVHEISPQGIRHTIPVQSIFGSPGHNEVYLVDPSTSLRKKLWDEVPVSGISSLWVCHVPYEELLQRLGIDQGNEEALRDRVQAFLGVANLCNLHVTVWDCGIRGSDVQIFVRISQGANFNTEVADKDDLFNIAETLHQFFCGTWEPISVGTCTRKTGLCNVPEYQTGFWYNHSGIGYSVSAASFELLSSPA